MPHPSDFVAMNSEGKVQPGDGAFQQDIEKDGDAIHDDEPLLSKDDPASEKLQRGADSTAAVDVHWVPHAPPTQMRWRRVRALGYIAFSAFNFSIMSACVKYASRHVTSHETVFWRTSIAWLLNFVRRVHWATCASNPITHSLTEVPYCCNR